MFHENNTMISKLYLSYIIIILNYLPKSAWGSNNCISQGYCTGGVLLSEGTVSCYYWSDNKIQLKSNGQKIFYQNIVGHWPPRMCRFMQYRSRMQLLYLLWLHLCMCNIFVLPWSFGWSKFTRNYEWKRMSNKCLLP